MLLIRGNKVNFQDKAGFIWSVAELLRGDYKQSEYGKVVLPFTVLRRLDWVLEPTKEAVLKKINELPANADDKIREKLLNRASEQMFHNLSPFTFSKLKGDSEHIGANINNYLNGFSTNIREIFIDKFNLPEQIDRLDKANLLYLIVSKFCEIDLHPDQVSNIEMGYIFEELIRRFSEQSNETAGEHFTPREVIRLMVNLLFCEDRDALTKPGVIRTRYDPASGTGGMLSVAEAYLRELNPEAKLQVFGQELNPESYAICKSDMMLKGQDPTHIHFGNSFTADGLPSEKFDYFLSNPPFGVEWRKVEKEIIDEHSTKGHAGRFGAGLPRVSDGSLLFLQHMVSKFKSDGSRLAIVFNGSPLFTGGAGSGESEIRRWIIENDMLEAIVGLPDQLFYNTGISTYIWVVTNRKPKHRKGKVQLVNATFYFQKMRKSLGNKRNEIPVDKIDEITRSLGDFQASETSKIFDNDDFGYWRITVERPLRLNFVVNSDRLSRLKETSVFVNLGKSKKKGQAGEDEIKTGIQLQDAVIKTLTNISGQEPHKNRDEFTKLLKKTFKQNGVEVPAALLKTTLTSLSERDETADICCDAKGNPEPDPDLRDYESVPLKDDINEYFKREVLPHVPDAWIDHDKTKKGYEIPFTRHFYKYQPLRPLEVIEEEIVALENEIQGMLKKVLE
ncbi:MAG: SAM-dependent DNA methyltransferase [Candidatus Riflebacteria bacterium]|nr:SAM-dependent DNA methyltransferase [Candidatus Riflebacteria bacterium]